MPTQFPGTRGSHQAEPSHDDLNFVDILLAIGITPIARFLKGKKTAAGAILAVLAYLTPLRDAADGTDFEQALNLGVAILEFASAWLGGGGLISWVLAARRSGGALLKG